MLSHRSFQRVVESSGGEKRDLMVTVKMSSGRDVS